MATEQVAVLNVDTSVAAKSIRELRQSVNKYRDDLVNLDDSTEEYTQTVQKLSQAQSELNRINIVTRQGGGNLIDIFTNTTRIAGNLSAGFTAAQGALALFGTESELLTQTFVKLQAAIALTQGLKGIIGLKNSFIAINSSIKAANISTKAFNLTLLANPFVAIGAAVVVLIGYFTDWEKELGFVRETIDEVWAGIKGLIPVLNDTSSLLDTLTQVISGVGTALIRLATGPIKTIISLIKGDFKGALNELASSFNIIGNFSDGYTAKEISNSEKRQVAIEDENRKIQLEAANTTKKLIEENEARYGSDYKYTQNGKKLYDQYFEQLLSSYDQDSEEYRKALNQKLAFDRQYAESRSKVNTTSLKNDQDEVDRILKSISDYNIPEIEVRINDLTTEYQKQLSLLEQYGIDTTELTQKYNDQIFKIRQDAQDRINNEVFQSRKNDLDDLKYNNNQQLNEIDLYIIQLENKLIGLRQNLMTAFQNDDEESIIDFSSQIEDVISQINEFEDEQFERNQEYQQEYAQLLQDLLDSDILTAEQRIEVQRKLNSTLYSLNLDSVNNQKLLINRTISEQQRQSKTENTILDIRKKQNDSYVNSLQQISGAISDILGSDTAAGKAFAVADATINTYKAAVSAMASTPGGPIAKALALTATIGTGLAAVKNIISTKIPGQSDSGVASVPNMGIPIPIPEIQDYYEPDIITNPNYLNSTENQEINQRVYIVESDIEDALDLNRTRVYESSF